MLLVLVASNKPTTVEMRLTMNQVAWTVTPRERLCRGLKLSEDSVSLFHPKLQVEGFQWRGAESFEATLHHPVAGRLAIPLTEESVVTLDGDEPFKTSLRLFETTRLIFTPARLDQVTIRLRPQVSDQVSWQAKVPVPGDDLRLRLREVDLPAAVSPVLEAPAPPLVLQGRHWPVNLGLTVHLQEPGRARLKIIDSQTGEITETKERLTVTLPADRLVVAIGEQLALLEQEFIDPEAHQLLRPGLCVKDLQLYDRVGDDIESFLLSGQIRFPGGEKPAAEIERRSLLEVPAPVPFKVRSLHLRGGDLDLVLSGKPPNLRLGPAGGPLEEILPSRLRWWSTHWLMGLIFTFLTAILIPTAALVISLVQKDKETD